MEGAEEMVVEGAEAFGEAATVEVETVKAVRRWQ